MMKVVRAVRVLLAVVVLMLVGVTPQVEAGVWPDSLRASTASVIPFYDISVGHIPFLILNNPNSVGGTFVEIFFYDQTCVKRADQLVSLTPIDTAVLNVGTLNPAAPAQGAILLRSAPAHFADVFNIDFVNGVATTLNSIILEVPPVNTSIDTITADWALYDTGAAIVTFGPKETADFITTITLSCPRSDLGAAMEGLTTGADDFSPATGTTTTVLDIFVFNTDEKFLGSIHNVTCRCFERKALKDWVPMALTSDVVVFFHGQNGTGTDRSIAGFQETIFIDTVTKYHFSTYLHHGPSPF